MSSTEDEKAKHQLAVESDEQIAYLPAVDPAKPASSAGASTDDIDSKEAKTDSEKASIEASAQKGSEDDVQLVKGQPVIRNGACTAWRDVATARDRDAPLPA